jgi:hypothetical protein
MDASMLSWGWGLPIQPFADGAGVTSMAQ